MKHVLWVVGLVGAGCSSDPDHYPIDPGGTPGVIGGVDAPRYADGPAGEDGAGDAPISGRVCLVTDLRLLTACSATDAAGITVSLGGGAAAVTIADGTFTVPGTSGTNLSWRATSAAIVTSTVPRSSNNLIPAIKQSDYAALLQANLATVQAGNGSIVVEVLQAGSKLPGATATAAPGAPQILYDNVSASTWVADPSQGKGMVWIPDASAGPTAVTITPPAGAAVVTTAAVESAAITFATVDIP
jgi:hypothetical protein